MPITVPRRTLVVSLLVAFACGVLGRAQPQNATPPGFSQLSAADWREDLAAFMTRLTDVHIDPFHATPRSTFEQEVQALDRALPSLSPAEIVARIIHLGALIGDSHSRVATSQMPVAPIELKWYGDELHIVRAEPGLRDLLGARVRDIGGVSVTRVLEQLKPFLSAQQNGSFDRLFSPFLLRSPLLLQTLKILNDPARLPLTIEQGGRTSQREIPATITGGQASQATDWIAYTPRVAETPLYARDRGRNWFTYLDEAGLAYIAFNTYGDDAQLAAFKKELDAFIDNKKPRRAVVDMRNNGGGDFSLGRWYIVRAVMRANQLLARGRLYVITGPDTFSAAAINALDFRRDTNAILIGEPLAERTWSYSDPQCGRLPRSGLLACYATRLYRLTDRDDPQIPLDRVIPMTWTDLESGRDPALTWVIGQPEPSRSR